MSFESCYFAVHCGFSFAQQHKELNSLLEVEPNVPSHNFRDCCIHEKKNGIFQSATFLLARDNHKNVCHVIKEVGFLNGKLILRFYFICSFRKIQSWSRQCTRAPKKFFQKNNAFATKRPQPSPCGKTDGNSINRHQVQNQKFK